MRLRSLARLDTWFPTTMSKEILRVAVRKVGDAHGVDGAHGGHGVALDAGNLHKAPDGIAGQAEMVLQRHLRRVFDLIDAHLEQLRQRGGGHGAGGADLGLTAALRAGDGRVGLDQMLPMSSGHGQRASGTCRSGRRFSSCM